MDGKWSIWGTEVPFSPRRSPVHYGWVVAVAGAVGLVASVPGQTMGVNVFSEQLMQALGLSRTQVSAAFFVGTGLSGLLMPWVGRLFDRFGARRLIVLGTAALAGSLWYLSVVDAVAAGMAGALGLGAASEWIRLGCLSLGFLAIRFFGQGVLTLSSRNMIGKWWVWRRGRVLSFAGIGVMVSFSLAPQVFDYGIETIGWRETWRVMALALAPGFILFAYLLFRDNPRECGLESDAGIEAEAGQAANPEFHLTRELGLPEALRCGAFWIFTLVFVAHACVFTGYVFHVVDVAADRGLAKAELLGLFVPTALVSGAVNLLSGWACDHLRLKYVLAWMSLSACFATVGLALFEGGWLKVALVAGLGASSGCFMTLSGVFMARFFGLKHLGAISGFFASLVVLGSAAGPLAFSVAQDWGGSYQGAYWAGALAFFALFVAAWWADNPQRRL